MRIIVSDSFVVVRTVHIPSISRARVASADFEKGRSDSGFRVVANPSVTKNGATSGVTVMQPQGDWMIMTQ